jgi:hypothetical protein
MLTQVNSRWHDGRAYSAMEGTVAVVDDADADAVAHMKHLVSAGQAEMVKDDPEPEPEPVVEPEPEPEPDVDAAVAADWYQSKTVLELRDLARERDLQVSGSKDELVARLMGDAE